MRVMAPTWPRCAPMAPRILLLALCVIAHCNAAERAFQKKIANGCRVIGGVCTTRAACGPQDAQRKDKPCGGLHLTCCIKDNGTPKVRKEETNIEKNPPQKKNRYIKSKNIAEKNKLLQGAPKISKQKRVLQENSNSKRIIYPRKLIENNPPNTKKIMARKKLPSKIGIGSASISGKPRKAPSTRQEGSCKSKKKCKKAEGTCVNKDIGCTEEEIVISKGCKKKSCQCCSKCKAKKKCGKNKGYCTNEKIGCPKTHKPKPHCLTEGCVCCIPIKIKPPKPALGCNQEPCGAANGICVKFAEDCPFGFDEGVNYLLCQGSDCKCCIGPSLTTPKSTTDLGTVIRNPECPKSPTGPETCPTCGLVNKPPVRVTGGQAVNFPNKYPWLVWLQHEGQLRCSGAIISSQFVLTAAHCLHKSCDLLAPQAIDVIIADHNINSELDDDKEETCTVKSQELIPHPDYAPCLATLHENDVGLIKLAAALNLAALNLVAPICLPVSASGSGYVGTQAVIAGWGKTNVNDANLPDLPHEANVQVLDPSTCERFWYWDQDHMLCAGGTTASQPKDACTGDSGTPLITELSPGKYTVIGLVTGGDSNCNGPGVYAKVDKYLTWIKDASDLANTCPAL